jgi:hypothetical protein
MNIVVGQKVTKYEKGSTFGEIEVRDENLGIR